MRSARSGAGGRERGPGEIPAPGKTTKEEGGDLLQDPKDLDLKPYGRLLEGHPGISASRMADILGVTVATVRKVGECKV